MQKKIRILLVDDHEVVRMGLRSFLETQTGLEVVAEAENGEDAIALVLECQPDVVVMDISMPIMDGLEATRKIKKLLPGCLILALTVHQDKQYFFEMLSAGASGYITKHAAAEELAAAIRSIAAGNVYLQPALARWLLEDYQRLLKQSASQNFEPGEPTSQEGLNVLSQRELQVLEALADGFSNIQIGEKLGISHRTVARHRERIMNKLNLHSRTELVKFAIRCGLVDIQ
ncbi:MAG: response regulator transcription factor [Anaerolineales bacterium]|nr:response regulator transcription factor [Anaerolineales bacterium]